MNVSIRRSLDQAWIVCLRRFATPSLRAAAQDRGLKKRFSGIMASQPPAAPPFDCGTGLSLVLHILPAQRSPLNPRIPIDFCEMKKSLVVTLVVTVDW